MKQRERMVCAMFLSCGLAWPIVTNSQEAEAGRLTTPVIDSRPHATQGPEAEGGRWPCAEPTDRKAAQLWREAALAKLLENYRYWVTEDARYLISPEERCTFVRLLSNEEREQFIEQFWYRRSADPNSPDDEFKTEHYRRIVFANENFGSDIPGWETDRGHIHVLFGPPDRVESHPREDPAWRAPEGGPDIPKYSWESWHYKYLEAMGKEADFEFVDPAASGMYRLRVRPADKDILLFDPPYNLGWHHAAERRSGASEGVEIHVGPIPVPRVKYKDLEAIITTQIVREQVHFTHRIEFARATYATTLARIVVNIPDGQLTIPEKDQTSTAGYAIFGQVSKPSGRVVAFFERTGKLGALEENGGGNPNREIAVALEPGSYRLALVVKDVGSGNVGVTRTTFEAPGYEALKQR